LTGPLKDQTNFQIVSTRKVIRKPIRKRGDLRRYQRIFVNKIKRVPYLILALPMGSGKSATTLTAMLDLLDDGEVRKVLVVAPLLVAAATWPDEIEEWEHTRLLEWTLIRAEDDDADVVAARKEALKTARDIIGLDAKEAQRFAGRMVTRAKAWKRQRLATENTEVHIINREALPWLWNFFGEGKRWPYDMIVVDEASMFKNGQMRTATKELTRFGVMAKARKLADRVVLLTGTPAPKGLQNLWGLSFIADGGERLGSSKHKFEQRYFDKGFMGWEMKPRPFAQAKIMERLEDIMFSLREEDCVDLPPSPPIEVPIKLSRRVMEEYERFEETLYSQRYDVEAVNKGVLHNKLLQFANGSMYDQDRHDVWIHDEKLAALEQIVEDSNGSPVLVAYSFEFDLARITKLFKKAVIFGRGGDVRKQKERWNRGEIELMLAHPASVGHGQNIQYGGNISVWYGLTPDLELYQQFNKRLHRSGQTKTVFNHHLIARGTYDERILPLLTKKDATQSEIIDSVRLSLR
jgi:SNF2 family DNA or RNA helicase